MQSLLPSAVVLGRAMGTKSPSHPLSVADGRTFRPHPGTAHYSPDPPTARHLATVRVLLVTSAATLSGTSPRRVWSSSRKDRGCKSSSRVREEERRSWAECSVGLRTRGSSRRAAATSGMVHSVQVDSAASTLSSANGSACPVQASPPYRNRGRSDPFGGQLPADVPGCGDLRHRSRVELDVGARTEPARPASSLRAGASRWTVPLLNRP